MGIFNLIFGDGGRAAGRAAQVQAESLDRSRAELAPFKEAGVDALSQQRALLGLDGQEAGQKAIESFTESPGQAFIRKRAQRNLLRNEAAIGGLGGGNVRTALAEQGAGFAATDLNNQFNRLSGLSTAGQNAATGTAGLIQNQGQAQASGVLGAEQGNQQRNSQLLKLGAGGVLGALTPGVGVAKGLISGFL